MIGVSVRLKVFAIHHSVLWLIQSSDAAVDSIDFASATAVVSAIHAPLPVNDSRHRRPFSKDPRHVRKNDNFF
ncbi:Hypothetical predicted protein [Olea europaea subsp. europaea]|uniref:Secreted protein n=1 Tax=Olea europaea subsp. europaea TaxID=158383 RepID=A0A8S0UYS7_OLEEU|nr:Hypothetical predicted protein [Olea europaea subsp. europaea]